MTPYATFEKLQPGDRIELNHEVKVGFKTWHAITRGTVLKTERRQHSLHFQRNHDDKVFSDIIVLQQDDGSITTVTLDEFSELKVLASGSATQ